MISKKKTGSLRIFVMIAQMWGGLAIRLTPNTKYGGVSRQLSKNQKTIPPREDYP